MMFFFLFEFRKDVTAGNDDIKDFIDRKIIDRLIDDLRIFIEFPYDLLCLFDRLRIRYIGMGEHDCIGSFDLVVEVFLEIDVVFSAGLDIDDTDMGNDTEIRICLDDIDDLGKLADT